MWQVDPQQMMDLESGVLTPGRALHSMNIPQRGHTVSVSVPRIHVNRSVRGLLCVLFPHLSQTPERFHTGGSLALQRFGPTEVALPVGCNTGPLLRSAIASGLRAFTEARNGKFTEKLKRNFIGRSTGSRPHACDDECEVHCQREGAFMHHLALASATIPATRESIGPLPFHGRSASAIPDRAERARTGSLTLARSMAA
jgi:hypothetical protein